ncbi:MAG: putative MFS family arabinose efflux permease [Acidimicrobiales bacterium]|jgi:predicted MFS family arabinose efflux permease
MTEKLSRPALVVAAVICTCVVVSHMFGRSTVSILLPAIRNDLIDSNTAAGVLGGSNFAGYIFGVIIVTLLAGRTEPIHLMRAGLAISAAALAMLAVAPSFFTLGIGVWLTGLGGAGIWVTAPALATANVPASRRGAVLGALTATMGIGLLGLSQGTTLYRRVVDNEDAWRPIFGIEAAIAVVVLAAAFVLVRPPRTGRQPERGAVFSASALRSIPQWKLLLACYTMFSALAGAWTQFLGLALKDDAGFSSAHINNLFSVFAVAGIVGPLALGQLSDRIGRDRTLAIAGAACVVASLLFTLNAEPWSSIAVGLYGGGSFSIPILTAAAVRDHLDNRSFGTAYGTITILYGLGSFSAALIAGVIADWRGSFDLVYVLLAMMAGLSSIMALVRFRMLASKGASRPSLSGQL